jgi:hypothetical protein
MSSDPEDIAVTVDNDPSVSLKSPNVLSPKDDDKDEPEQAKVEVTPDPDIH